jgi:hypothetical protein
LADHVGDDAVAVRSSVPGEDSQQLSFARLHESIVGVKGDRAVIEAVPGPRALLMVLQARPITTSRSAAGDELIPALESEGARLASHEFAAALLERAESLRRWKDI